MCRLCTRMHMDVFVASVCALDLNACRSFCAAECSSRMRDHARIVLMFK